MYKYLNGISLLSILLVLPAMAGATNTSSDNPAWVFGDVSFTDQHVATGAAAFGGRRLADSNVSGKYHNVFPQYNMVGQSFALYDSEAYFGPITLTLGTLDEGDNFAFNWQAPDGNDVVDMDIAAAAQIGWGESVADYATIGTKLNAAMTIIFSDLGYTGETLDEKVAEAVSGAHNAVYAMSRIDTDTNNDGVLTLNNVDATVDGATITAKTISVTNGSKLTVEEKDTTRLNTSAVFYTNEADIISDGMTTLNADKIDIIGSTLEVKPGAKLVLNPEGINGATIRDVETTAYGALTVNGGGSIETNGSKLTFSGNKTAEHGAALYFKDQAYGSGETHTSTDSVVLNTSNILFMNNEVIDTGKNVPGSGGAIFVTGGSVSILGENIGFINNYMNGQIAEGREFKVGGGAIANQSYAIESGDNKGLQIDADMIVGKGGEEDQITFSSNTSRTNGGAIMNRAVDTDGNATLTINSGWNTTFTSNHADINGGAIYNVARNGRTAEVNLTIGDSDRGDNYLFVGNTAGENGGAIYNEGTLSVISAMFGKYEDSGNNATEGGAIYNAGIMDILRGQFRYNTADSGGAIMNSVVDTSGDATLTLNGDTSFIGNQALNGGAIYNIASNDKKATINMIDGNYVFIGNTATTNGGAIYNEGTLSLDNASFGGIYASWANTAKNGGAVYNKSSATITDSTFIGNSVLVPDTDATYKREGVGGAIASAGSLMITGSTFTNNMARTTGTGWGLGGALSTVTVDGNATDMTISGSTFTGNSADVGGAVYGMLKATNQHGLSEITVSGSKFEENSALAGSAIANFDIMSVVNSTFSGNTTFGADDGGTVFLGSESVTSFTNGIFKNNMSNTVGGAIATRSINNNNSYAKLDISGTVFKGNSTTTTGGAIDNNFYNSSGHKGSVYISGATFGGTGTGEGNSAANGGAIYNHANATKTGSMYLNNNVFIGNSATSAGGAIYNEGEIVLAGVNGFEGNKVGTDENKVANDIHNIGTLAVEGTTTLNGGITGNTGTLIIANNATLNLGTASVIQDKIILDGGTITATLNKDATSAQLNASAYMGVGTLKLTMAETGTYHVFGGEFFNIEDIDWDIKNAERGITFANSTVYNLTWNKGDVIAERKSVEEIATESEIAVETAAVISNIIDSASNSSLRQMKELSVKLQEKLADGDTASVEHATKAISPEKESVVQSVASSVQNTVASLAAGRMSMPMVGRSGGDKHTVSTGAWAQGIYNKTKQNNAFNGSTRGIAVGIDQTVDKKWMLGFGYSFAKSNIEGTARDTDIDSSTLFVYGQYKPKNWYINVIGNYTSSDYKEKGDVLGEIVKADYDVKAFGANVSTGYDFAGGITPELGLRYIHIMSDDYINSFHVKNHLNDADYLTAVLGTKYTHGFKTKKGITLQPDFHYAIKYDLISDKQAVSVTMPGVDTYALNGDRLSRIGAEIGAGFGINYKRLDVSLNYDLEVRESYTSQTGRVKFRYNF